MNQSDKYKQQLEIYISQLVCLYYLRTLLHFLQLSQISTSYRDIHKGKKSGMSLQSQGNHYELHPNYKATVYGNRNNVDAKYQSISPVYAMVAQR
ncbi:hypothetical protein, partial [Francisella philomiragia]